MQYAVDQEGNRITAVRKVNATCPMCKQAVIAKCGAVKVHHWSHVAGDDCDRWYEPESEWHRAWKALFPPSQVEVAMGEHRADIRTSEGLVIELQNSPISPAEIEARERFYKRMIWIVNSERFVKSLYITKLMSEPRALFAFKWKHAAASWRAAKMPVFLDLGSTPIEVLHAGKLRQVRAFFTEDVAMSTFTQTQLVRYRGPAAAETRAHYDADDAFAGLPEAVRGSTILRLNTLHANGCGSAYALPREAIVPPLQRADFARPNVDSI